MSFPEALGAPRYCEPSGVCVGIFLGQGSRTLRFPNWVLFAGKKKRVKGSFFQAFFSQGQVLWNYMSLLLKLNDSQLHINIKVNTLTGRQNIPDSTGKKWYFRYILNIKYNTLYS